MARLIERHARKDPHRAALIDADGALDWSAFNDRVNRLINGLRGLGLGAGDLISIYAGNCRAYYEVMAAAGHAGMLFVPVNWHFTPEELAYVIDNSESKLLIADAQFIGNASDAVARGETPTLQHCISIGGNAPGFVDYEAFIAASANDEPEGQVLRWADVLHIRYDRSAEGRAQRIAQRTTTDRNTRHDECGSVRHAVDSARWRDLDLWPGLSLGAVGIFVSTIDRG